MSWYLGIDPGKTGGVALLHNRKAHLHRAISMPVKELPKSKKTEIDIEALKQFIYPYRTRIKCAAIEKVSSSPQMGVTSSFSFGMAVGILKGLLIGLEINFMLVTPQRWKTVMLEQMTKDKSVSVRVAEELYPSLKSAIYPTGKRSRVLKPKDGVAEAILLANYAYLDFKGLITPEDLKPKKREFKKQTWRMDQFT